MRIVKEANQVWFRGERDVCQTDSFDMGIPPAPMDARIFPWAEFIAGRKRHVLEPNLALRRHTILR
jgi:hypothetical protein